MAKSGVAVADDVKDIYDEIKQKKTLSYIIFKLSEDYSEIQVCKKGRKDENFESFRTAMFEASENGEGRYAVYDVKDEDDDSKHSLGKLCFITWVDDAMCKTRAKMLYASSKDIIKQACEGVAGELQINDQADFTIEQLKEKVSKGKKK